MLKFTEDHEWLQHRRRCRHRRHHRARRRVQLGDLVFVELPEVGAKLAKGDEAATVESVKAASEIYAPLAGEVDRGQPGRSSADPALVNPEPLGAGWFFKLKLDDLSALDALMDEAAYKAMIG